MLLDEDPAALIHECTTNFSLAPDRASLNRITSSLATLHSTRQQRLSTHQARLKQLARRQNTLQQSQTIAQSSHDPAAHAAEILRLDKLKFKVAKEASDLEVEQERLEREVGAQEQTLREVERGEREGGRKIGGVVESDVLKLRLYRSLGIDLEAGGSGVPSKAVVRSMAKGEVAIVPLDNGVKMDEVVNRFWEAL